MRLLRLSELQYAECIEAFGYRYVRFNCDNCPRAEQYLTRTRAFWRWWMRQHDIRDEVFLATYGSYTQAECVPELRLFWLEHHAPEAIHPWIPDPAWQQMLDLIDKELEEKRKKDEHHAAHYA